MMGGRGAKGSLNDRIISFLFRKRYLEYLKKKESYTKEQRKKAKDYLKRIQQFDIDDSVNVLDDTDKVIIGNLYQDLSINDFLGNDNSNIEITGDIKKTKGYDEVSKISTGIKKVESSKLSEELINSSKKLEEFDPLTEEFNFDKYDYYEIISNKTGIGNIKKDEIIDPKKQEKKLTDEEIILEEVNTFIDSSKEDLYEIKNELDELKKDVKLLHTEEDIIRFNDKFNKVKEEINKLKTKYEIIKEKYDFEDYDILDSLKLVDTIEDYKDEATLEELELMVDACKYEIEAIDGVVIEDEKSVGIGEDVYKKHKIIKQRDKMFDTKKKETINIDYNYSLIQEEMEKQQKIILELDEKLKNITEETRQVEYYVYNTRRMFGSFLRITAGILTAPFSGVRIFNTMLGTGLINRGLRNLRTSLIPDTKVRTEVRHRYTSVENEILKAKDDVKSTKYFINDSIKQIEEIKEYLNTSIKEEKEYIPEYNDVKDLVEKLDKSLKLKKEEIDKYEKSLENQYQNNKQKVLKAQKGFHTPNN